MSTAIDSARFRLEREVFDAAVMRRIVRRMAGEIIERQADLSALLLAGIRTRGVPLARLLAADIEAMEGRRPDLGTLDITLYRDDLSTIAPQPVVKASELPSTVDEREVVLCDDVLYTGRTVRAALDALNDYGRPRAVRLAVLVDRGHRELPIQADVVGATVPTEADELVEVGFRDVDGDDYVRLHRRVGYGPGADDGDAAP